MACMVCGNNHNYEIEQENGVTARFCPICFGLVCRASRANDDDTGMIVMLLDIFKILFPERLKE